MKKIKMFIAVMLAVQGTVFAGKEIYRDSSASAEVRADDLIARMTLEEKVA